MAFPVSKTEPLPGPPLNGWPMRHIMFLLKPTIVKQCKSYGIAPLNGSNKDHWAAVMFDYGMNPANQPGGGVAPLIPSVQIHANQPVFASDPPSNIIVSAANDPLHFNADEYDSSEPGVNAIAFSSQLLSMHNPPSFDIYNNNNNNNNNNNDDGAMSESYEEINNVEEAKQHEIDPPPPEQHEIDPPPPEQHEIDPPPPEQHEIDPPPPEQYDNDELEPQPDFDFIERNDEIMQFCVTMGIRGQSAVTLCGSDMFYLVDLLSHDKKSLVEECNFSTSDARMIFNRIVIYKEMYGPAGEGDEAIGDEPAGEGVVLAGGGAVVVAAGGGAVVVAGNGAAEEKKEENKDEHKDENEPGAFSMIVWKNKNRLIYSVAPTEEDKLWLKFFLLELVLSKGLYDTIPAITHLIDNNTKGGRAAQIRYYYNNGEWEFAPVFLSRSIVLKLEIGGFCKINAYQWYNVWKGGRPHVTGNINWSQLSRSYDLNDPVARGAQDNMILSFRGSNVISSYIVRTNDQANCRILGWYGNNNVNLNYDLPVGDMVDNLADDDMVNDDD
eukprot:189756_1